MTNLRFEPADKDYECNASLFIQGCLEDIMEDLSEQEKKDIELAEAHGWKVLKGERCRMYTWGAGTEEENECVEIPAMAEICTNHDLWP